MDLEELVHDYDYVYVHVVGPFLWLIWTQKPLTLLGQVQKRSRMRRLLSDFPLNLSILAILALLLLEAGGT